MITSVANQFYEDEPLTFRGNGVADPTSGQKVVFDFILTLPDGTSQTWSNIPGNFVSGNSYRASSPSFTAHSLGNYTITTDIKVI